MSYYHRNSLRQSQTYVCGFNQGGYTLYRYLGIFRIGFVYTWVASIWEAARWKEWFAYFVGDTHLGCSSKMVVSTPFLAGLSLKGCAVSGATRDISLPCVFNWWDSMAMPHGDRSLLPGQKMHGEPRNIMIPIRGDVTLRKLVFMET